MDGGSSEGSDSGLPDGLAPEMLPPVDCPADDCLVVEEGSTFCSVGPPQLREGAIFSTKSELTVSAGAYPLTGGAVSGLSATLRTPAGEAQLTPVDEASYEVTPEYVEDGFVIDFERAEVEAAFAGGGVEAEPFLLSVARWPHRHFRLGDPEDLSWFFRVRRRLFIRVDGSSALFPTAGSETIQYLPCSLRGQPDDSFVFQFADGSSMTLTTRYTSGISALGYYVGRLMSARGEVMGQEIDVEEPFDLAFIGSDLQVAEARLPSLAVRTGSEGDSCGVLFDVTQWDTPDATDAYVAYRLTCDGRRGAELPLESVSYPEDRYALP